MSIRTKLLISYIAMIVIPVLVFVLTMFLLANLFINYRTDPGEESFFKEQQFDKNDEMFSGLSYLIEYNPAMFSDPDFMNHVEEQLEELKAGLVIEKNGVIEYMTPTLGEKQAVAEVIREQKDEKRFSHWFKLNGDEYSLQQKTFAYEGEGSGTLYFFHNTVNMKRMMMWFFPLMLISLLLVIGLTNGLLTYLLSRSIVRPLKKLKEAAEQIKEGNLNHPVNLARKDEIGQLSSSFEEMRQRLQESIRLQLQYEDNRKELLANISHDLKTPITAIANCIDGLRDGIADTPEKQRKYLDMMYNKISGMDSQIEELFLFSKLDLKKLAFQIEEIDLDSFLANMVEELRLDPRYRDVTLGYSLMAPAPIYVLADREKLGRVMFNIIGNSLKSLDKEPKRIQLKVSDGDAEGKVTVHISDNGSGIDSEALPYIFDRFFRADRSRNQDKGGSGLGLAIVKQMIEEHGGTVWAESTEGAGTELFFTLNKVTDRGT